MQNRNAGARSPALMHAASAVTLILAHSDISDNVRACVVGPRVGATHSSASHPMRMSAFHAQHIGSKFRQGYPVLMHYVPG